MSEGQLFGFVAASEVERLQKDLYETRDALADALLQREAIKRGRWMEPRHSGPNGRLPMTDFGWFVAGFVAGMAIMGVAMWWRRGDRG